MSSCCVFLENSRRSSSFMSLFSFLVDLWLNLPSRVMSQHWRQKCLVTSSFFEIPTKPSLLRLSQTLMDFSSDHYHPVSQSENCFLRLSYFLAFLAQTWNHFSLCSIPLSLWKEWKKLQNGREPWSVRKRVKHTVVLWLILDQKWYKNGLKRTYLEQE